jgi:hypothetical protein
MCVCVYVCMRVCVVYIYTYTHIYVCIPYAGVHVSILVSSPRSNTPAYAPFQGDNYNESSLHSDFPANSNTFQEYTTSEQPSQSHLDHFTEFSEHSQPLHVPRPPSPDTMRSRAPRGISVKAPHGTSVKESQGTFGGHSRSVQRSDATAYSGGLRQGVREHDNPSGSHGSDEYQEETRRLMNRAPDQHDSRARAGSHDVLILESDDDGSVEQSDEDDMPAGRNQDLVRVRQPRPGTAPDAGHENAPDAGHENAHVNNMQGEKARDSDSDSCEKADSDTGSSGEEDACTYHNDDGSVAERRVYTAPGGVDTREKDALPPYNDKSGPYRRLHTAPTGGSSARFLNVETDGVVEDGSYGVSWVNSHRENMKVDWFKRLREYDEEDLPLQVCLYV